MAEGRAGVQFSVVRLISSNSSQAHGLPPPCEGQTGVLRAFLPSLLSDGGCGWVVVTPMSRFWAACAPSPPPPPLPAELGEVEAGQEVAECGQEKILVYLTGNDLTRGKVQHQPTAACL